LAEIILRDFSQLDYELTPIDQIYADLSLDERLAIDFQELDEQQRAFVAEFWQSPSWKNQTALQERFLSLWRRLPKLYRRFHENLQKNNLSNHPSIYRRLIEDPALQQQFQKRFKKVLFVGFNALSKAEKILFKK